MNRGKLLFCFFFLYILFSGTGIWAFNFEPITMDFEPAGRGANRTFRVENNGREPIAVRISMMTREMNLDGSDKNADAQDYFLVYPSQIVLQPGAFQAVRVQWKGPSTVNTEQAYRIIAEQLPVNFGEEDKAGGSINIMFRYIGSVYVVPPKASPDINVDSAGPIFDDAGIKKLEIVCTNAGNAHTILQDLRIYINKGELELAGDSLSGMNGENILAGATRRFLLDWPEQLQDGEIDVQLDFRNVR